MEEAQEIAAAWLRLASVQGTAIFDAGSSNGRTSDFDSDGRGSNPLPVESPDVR